MDAVLTDENRDVIAAVRADPHNAWRGQPRSRKIAHLRQRGVPLTTTTSDREVDAHLERMMLQDDSVPTHWFGAGARVADAVALIRQPEPATGFLVSDWLLLTNHHVLDTPETAEGAEVLFRYAEDAVGGIAPEKLSFDPARCFITSPVDELDYTLVGIGGRDGSDSPGARFGTIPLISSVGKAIVGQPLNIVQHPGGQSRRVAFRNNRLLAVEERRLVYETDTERGSSGSPVLNDRWQVVALHHASESARNAGGDEIDVNGQLVTPSTPDYLRQWVANAGIRVSRIVADLRERDLDVGTRALVDAAIAER
ncbi:trypsin-like serine peptidase [Actinomycetospora atypica]|uniref:Trypsin-like serine peptidase n=1 Tax=Actinomycetospora atypica TaxID=1290095 RepID=A0ABV9YLX7_9PSEU